MDENLISEEIEQLTNIYQLVVEFFVTYSFQLLGATIIFLVGIFAASKISNLVLHLMEKKKFDVTLAGFIASGVKLLLIAVFLIIALGKIGISIGPFVAALGAVSLGIGLALQGTLANYGAGITLIITRPFVVGDTICISSVNGIVTSVKLSHTLLIDEDGVEYTIPNKHIVGEIIANSHADSLIELSIGISYKDSPQRACEVIENCLVELAKNSTNKKPLIGIDEFADSGITIGIRFWTPTEKIYETKYAANQAIHQAILNEGIEIPYPQRELRILNNAGERTDI